MPQVVHIRKGLKLKLILPLIAVGLCVVVAGFAVVWYVVIPSQRSLNDVLAEASKLSGTNKTTEAITLLDDRSSHTLNKTDKYKLALAKGSAYQNAKRYSEAKGQYELAVRLGGESSETDQAMAVNYEKLGDKTSAKLYYQKLVDYYKTQPDGRYNYGQYYQSLISEMSK